MSAEGPSRYGVAAAGIAATALVGIAGTVGSWLIARDDRASQRTLANEERASQRLVAHEQRVYDRRAAAYVDALVLMDRQRDELLDIARRVARHPEARPELGNERPLLARDRTVYARIRTYGSQSIVSLYVDLRVSALQLWSQALANSIPSGFGRFRSLENRFARIAGRELR